MEEGKLEFLMQFKLNVYCPLQLWKKIKIITY